MSYEFHDVGSIADAFLNGNLIVGGGHAIQYIGFLRVGKIWGISVLWCIFLL